MTRREGGRSPRRHRAHVRAAVGGTSVPGEVERADILLDAPQLKVKTLALEIENLNLANLVRIGKVRLEVENLDAELFLQTQLGNLLYTVNRLISTLNLSLSLFFAPVHSVTVAVAAWSDYLELRRRGLELPIKFFEGCIRPDSLAAARSSASGRPSTASRT